MNGKSNDFKKRFKLAKKFKGGVILKYLLELNFVFKNNFEGVRTHTGRNVAYYNYNAQ